MKKIAGAIISLGLVLFFTGCTWELPERISVKTNAEYNFLLGKFKKSFDQDGQKLDLSTMMGNAGEGNAAIEVFDYFPGKKDSSVQQYGLKVQLLEQDYHGTYTDEQLENLPWPQTIDGQNVPSQQITLDFNPSSILKAIKTALGNTDLPIEFPHVQMYVYCHTGKDLDLENLEMKMFYAKDGSKVGSTEIVLLDNPDKPRFAPDLNKDGDVVISDLSKSDYSNVVDVA